MLTIDFKFVFLADRGSSWIFTQESLLGDYARVYGVPIIDNKSQIS